MAILTFQATGIQVDQLSEIKSISNQHPMVGEGRMSLKHDNGTVVITAETDHIFSTNKIREWFDGRMAPYNFVLKEEVA